MLIQQARQIARIAHAAVGQKRADGKTPYIVHPDRVADLVHAWNGHPKAPHAFGDADLAEMICAALLHDVLEDTKLTAEDLAELGANAHIVEMVQLLTKPGPQHHPETAAYYAAIGGHTMAMIIKCADACANLEDVLLELQEGRGIKRWRNYVRKIDETMLPTVNPPFFYRNQVETRLELIQRILEVLPPTPPCGKEDCAGDPDWHCPHCGQHLKFNSGNPACLKCNYYRSSEPRVFTATKTTDGFQLERPVQ